MATLARRSPFTDSRRATRNGPNLKERCIRSRGVGIICRKVRGNRLIEKVGGGRSWRGLRKIHGALYTPISILIHNCRRVWNSCVGEGCQMNATKPSGEMLERLQVYVVALCRNFANLLLPLRSGPHPFGAPEIPAPRFGGVNWTQFNRRCVFDRPFQDHVSG